MSASAANAVVHHDTTVHGKGSVDLSVLNEGAIGVNTATNKYPVQFFWTFTNYPFAAVQGSLVLSVDGHVVTNPQLPALGELAPSQNVSGEFELPGFSSAGSHHVSLAFELSPIAGSGNGATFGRADVTVSVVDLDVDKDGLDDLVERNLLDKFRPYYVFSSGEDYRPADAIDYLRHSSLLTEGYSILAPQPHKAPIVPEKDLSADPSKIFVWSTWPNIAKSSNFQLTHCKSLYWISPESSVQHGSDWGTVQTVGNIGLYGHVTWNRNTPNLVDIEYWQFYGYNKANFTTIGDHQGDWESVVVTVDPNKPDQIVYVTHYVHGAAIQFKSFPYPLPTQPANSTGRITFHGPNYLDIAVDLDLSDSSSLKIAQDAVVEVMCQQLFCTHPVVYIENGTHASWPQTGWKWPDVPKHDGKGPAFLTTTPPNLGEPSNPMTETPFAYEILNYSGMWGAYSQSVNAGKLGKVNTNPPHGPALHNLFARPNGGAPPSSCLE
ncbi:MAG: hypothetical protein M3O26_11390 [Pseudomonadota bacterium]|nr:hypothetical protein [Pseudomonadota bacterium]